MTFQDFEPHELRAPKIFVIEFHLGQTLLQFRYGLLQAHLWLMCWSELSIQREIYSIGSFIRRGGGVDADFCTGYGCGYRISQFLDLVVPLVRTHVDGKKRPAR